MKKNLLALTIILSASIAFATPAASRKGHASANTTTTFGALDTVYFDLTQAVIINGYVEFPVYFKLNTPTDTSNSLDFSLKFDTSKFAYDTTITIPNYMDSYLAHYDTTGLTLYYSASTIRGQGITNDTVLVKVRLWILVSGQLCLNSVLAYLNGDACSVKVSNNCSIVLGVSDIKNKNLSFSLYPNPTSGISNLKFYSDINETANLSISALTGRNVMNEKINLSLGNNNHPLDLNNLSNGIYLLALKSAHGNDVIRIVKQ